MKGLFKVRSADSEWLKEQIEKGNLFMQTMRGEFVPCGAYRRNRTSYDAMSVRAVMREIKYKNIYYKKVN